MTSSQPVDVQRSLSLVDDKDVFLLRLSSGSIRNTIAYPYIIDQYHKYQVTGAKYCKEKDEMSHLAGLYLCLLESTRKQAELSAQYSKGERSIQEAASIVGLSMPDLYKDKE